MSEKTKMTRFISFWKRVSKDSKDTFYVSNSISFGELRNIIKEFKDANDLSDSDKVNFMLFKCKSDNEKAPQLNLNIKQDTYEKKD